MTTTMNKYRMKYAKYRKFLETFFVDIAILLGASESIAKEDAAKVIKFEFELMNISVSK